MPKSFSKDLACSEMAFKVQDLKINNISEKCEISNLIFTSMGQKEVEFKWKELNSSIKCEVLAGSPVQLDVLDWVVDEVLCNHRGTICDLLSIVAYLVHSGKPLSLPFTVQLMDVERNPCLLSNIKVQIVRDQKLKLQPSPVFETDNLGIADFDFTVTVISEEAASLRSASADQISMKLWKKDGAGNNVKTILHVCFCHPIQDFVFITLDFCLLSPENAGARSFRQLQHHVCLFDGTVELNSVVNSVNVSPGSLLNWDSARSQDHAHCIKHQECGQQNSHKDVTSRTQNLVLQESTSGKDGFEYLLRYSAM
ncbi:hypothetical protein Btru_077222 [Bulinus truncatus]|nr:hypothetical protein Btru_077222 [Bulinus truncatus]